MEMVEQSACESSSGECRKMYAASSYGQKSPKLSRAYEDERHAWLGQAPGVLLVRNHIFICTDVLY